MLKTQPSLETHRGWCLAGATSHLCAPSAQEAWHNERPRIRCYRTEATKSPGPGSPLHTRWPGLLALRPGALERNQDCFLTNLSSAHGHSGARSQARPFNFHSSVAGHCTWEVPSPSGPPLWPACLLLLAKGLSNTHCPGFYCFPHDAEPSLAPTPQRSCPCRSITETEVLCLYPSGSQEGLPVGHAPLFYGRLPLPRPELPSSCRSCPHMGAVPAPLTGPGTHKCSTNTCWIQNPLRCLIQ